MRARMGIVYASVQAELREVDLKNKPQALLDISPKGTVPVLQLVDGTVIEESLDVLNWSLDQSDPDHWRTDWSKAALDAMNTLIAENDHQFVIHLRQYKYPDRYPDISEGEAFNKVCRYFNTYEERLRSTSHLFGDRISWADMAILPFVRQAYIVNTEKFEDSGFPNLLNWMKSFLDSPLMEKVMVKTDPWDETKSSNPKHTTN